MSSIDNKTVVDFIYNNNLPFKGERYELLKKVTVDVLVTPLKVMALLIAVSGIFAMVFEVRYFSQYSLQIYFTRPVSYTHLRAHETDSYLVCRLLLEKKK